MSRSRYHLQNWALALFVGFLTFSCKPATETDDHSTMQDTTSVQKKYTVTPLSESPDFPDARLESMDYRNGKFTFQIGGESYKLGIQTSDASTKGCANSTEGQHIHLIVDDQPYLAKYESTFDHEIPDGEHYLLAFLSRSYHESIKSKDAAIAVRATIQNKSIAQATPVTQPMLFYSRPKGAYQGDDTKRILLDYYLVNPNPDHKVRALINGEEHILETWQPYVIEGLPAGDNEITLMLIDAAGNKVETDLNPVTRRIVVTPNPPAN